MEANERTKVGVDLDPLDGVCCVQRMTCRSSDPPIVPDYQL
jgi:hypothetical protein